MVSVTLGLGPERPSCQGKRDEDGEYCREEADVCAEGADGEYEGYDGHAEEYEA